MRNVPRFKAWSVTKEREEFATPSGLEVAERGAVVGVIIADRWEDVAEIMRRLDAAEKDDAKRR